MFLALLATFSAPALASVHVEVAVPGIVVAVNPWSPVYVPASRPGWVWVPGYYDSWGGWHTGYWRPAASRVGYTWIDGYWNGAYWVDGYWRHSPGYVYRPPAAYHGHVRHVAAAPAPRVHHRTADRVEDRHDRAEDRYDKREDRADRAEDRADRAEDRRDQHPNDAEDRADRAEDRGDRAEDRGDRREDGRDRAEDHRDRRSR